jgi:hypothetical protein
MRLQKAAMFIFGLGLLAGQSCFAAAQPEDSSNCSAAYENDNQVENPPPKIHIIQGSTEIDVATERQTDVAGACFTLFTEKDHALVAGAKSSANGHLEFDAVPPGRYRLVARANGLCAANVSIVVVKSPRVKSRIVFDFVAAGIDACSYGE